MMNYKAASDSELLVELNKLSGDSSVGISSRKKEFLYVVRHLETDERAIAVLSGDLDGKKGTLILLTSINIHFIRISLFKKIHHDKFPIVLITKCDDKKGLLFSKIIFNINHEQEYVFSNIEKKALDKFLPRLNESTTAYEALSYGQDEPQARTSQPEITSLYSEESKPSILDTSSLVEKLELIEELKDFETINNKEFNILKNYILESNLDNRLATVNIKALCEDLDRLNDFVNEGVITKKDFSTQKQALLAALPTNNQSQ
ncbi:PH domain-containing protein [Xenorhabdus sp. XENO-10]|uniref:PH domain-containing protein n=1 Tax=Xenorhabdus yunnanensis TaxID=3025878 RepID=A0ABT5LJQ9_9GAMM|nr:PH domain-containing protein [Xenorhabdus yunnanensis]MDC9590010.1 PH domain-containing protein [Xenorhabdus yunnanensis]